MAGGGCEGSDQAGRCPAVAGPPADDETFADCVRKFVQILPRISRGLRRHPTPCTGADVKLGPRHGVALSMLRERGARTVGTLAAELGLTLATVSGIVAELEQVGFLSRSPDPTDRRRTMVALVERPTDAVGLWLDTSTAPVARALEKLTADERATLLKAMTFLDAELEAPRDEVPSRSKR